MFPVCSKWEKESCFLEETLEFQGLPFAFWSCAEVVNAAENCVSLKLGMVSHKTLPWIFKFLLSFFFSSLYQKEL